MDRRVAGSRRVRRRGAAADGGRPGGPQARGTRRLRGELPRQRRVRLRRLARRAGREDRRVPQGPRRDRARGDHGHHEPVRTPDFQGRRVHGERARGPPVRARQGDAQPGPGRRAGREDVRLLGWQGGRRVRGGQGRQGRARPVRRGAEPAVGVRHRPGVRHPVRDRAEAERAARRHPAADRGQRARLHQLSSRTRRWWGSTPRSGTRRWRG